MKVVLAEKDREILGNLPEFHVELKPKRTGKQEQFKELLEDAGDCLF